jgi:hypothetical protein
VTVVAQAFGELASAAGAVADAVEAEDLEVAPGQERQQAVRDATLPPYAGSVPRESDRGPGPNVNHSLVAIGIVPPTAVLAIGFVAERSRGDWTYPGLRDTWVAGLT